MPRSSSALSSVPTWASCSIMPSMYSLSPCWYLPRFSAFTCVRRCMRVPFHQQKNGLPASFCRFM